MKSYRLTDEAGGTWTWTENQLDDTLFESEHWESKKSKVKKLKVGQKLKSGGEAVERLENPEHAPMYENTYGVSGIRKLKTKLLK